MGGGQTPSQRQDAIRRYFRSLSVQPSLPPSLPVRETSVPLRTSSLPSAPRARKPSFPLRASSLQSASSDPSSPDSISDAEHALALGFAARTPAVHPVIALRYKWRTACAKALQTETPDESFLSVMKRRGVALPAPVKTDLVRTASSAALSSTARRGSATHLLAERAPRITRAAKLINAPTPPLDFTPSAAATKRQPSDHGLRRWRTERNTLMRLSPPECISISDPPPVASAAAAARRRSSDDGTNTWRTETGHEHLAQTGHDRSRPVINTWSTELSTLMRLPPPNEEEEASRLPGALRCAKAHAPRALQGCLAHKKTPSP